MPPHPRTLVYSHPRFRRAISLSSESVRFRRASTLGRRYPLRVNLNRYGVGNKINKTFYESDALLILALPSVLSHRPFLLTPSSSTRLSHILHHSPTSRPTGDRCLPSASTEPNRRGKRRQVKATLCGRTKSCSEPGR